MIDRFGFTILVVAEESTDASDDELIHFIRTK